MTLTSIGLANCMTCPAETRPSTWRLREDVQPVWLKECQSKDDYATARKALTQMTQGGIVQTVKDPGLEGRGDADFPASMKWGLMPRDESLNICYLLCSADETEPNTWEDHMLMEQLPHLLVEGMLISVRALKAYYGYTFLRGEYVNMARNLNRAIDETKATDLLGKDVLGNDFDFEPFVHTGAGHYICSEETVLISSLEGCRTDPRSKPLFPVVVDIWDKPTCVNNAETLYNAPAIVGNGVDWYKILARPGSEDMGTKLVGSSDKAKNPGLWELPFGVSARELFRDHAGGMRDGF